MNETATVRIVSCQELLIKCFLAAYSESFCLHRGGRFYLCKHELPCGIQMPKRISTTRPNHDWKSRARSKFAERTIQAEPIWDAESLQNKYGTGLITEAHRSPSDLYSFASKECKNALARPSKRANEMMQVHANGKKRSQMHARTFALILLQSIHLVLALVQSTRMFFIRKLVVARLPTCMFSKNLTPTHVLHAEALEDYHNPTLEQHHAAFDHKTTTGIR